VPGRAFGRLASLSVLHRFFSQLDKALNEHGRTLEHGRRMVRHLIA